MPSKDELEQDGSKKPMMTYNLLLLLLLRCRQP
jgi:hypothetical protein